MNEPVARRARCRRVIMFVCATGTDFSMDISRDEQRVLHALAQGGRIALLKDPSGKVTGLEFFNRDGWLMPNCSLALFRKLKAKKAIRSQGGQPYRITRRGLELVRSEVDNR
jgi:uncharacterized protein YjhX (UPF0386 family)